MTHYTPGKGGNPGFNKYDLDSSLRTIFYPAIIGWTLLGVWIVQIRKRLETLKNHVRVND